MSPDQSRVVGQRHPPTHTTAGIVTAPRKRAGALHLFQLPQALHIGRLHRAEVFPPCVSRGAHAMLLATFGTGR
jgi:hypothetical protein